MTDGWPWRAKRNGRRERKRGNRKGKEEKADLNLKDFTGQRANVKDFV
jgi:hypothetical protein